MKKKTIHINLDNIWETTGVVVGFILFPACVITYFLALFGVIKYTLPIVLAIIAVINYVLNFITRRIRENILADKENQRKILNEHLLIYEEIVKDFMSVDIHKKITPDGIYYIVNYNYDNDENLLHFVKEKEYTKEEFDKVLSEDVTDIKTSFQRIKFNCYSICNPLTKHISFLGRDIALEVVPTTNQWRVNYLDNRFSVIASHFEPLKTEEDLEQIRQKVIDELINNPNFCLGTLYC